MFSCGLGPQKLFGAIFFPALPVMLLLLLMTLWLSPLAEQKAHHIREVAEQSGPLATLEPGRFATLDGGRLTVYVADVPKGGAEVKELFVQYQEDDRQILITAREAHIVRDSDNAPSYIEFIDGVRYQGEAGQADWQVTQFAKHGLKLKEPRSPLVQDEPSMLLPEVLVRSDRVEYAAELQWRLAVPVMLFVSLWLVLPLGNAPPRQGRFGRLLVGIVLYMLYLNGLMLLKKYIGDGRFPVFPGLWMIHAMALAAVWGVNQHQFGRRSVRPIRQEEGRS
jgi:lipopolysaccharide export system permease protein